MIDAFLTLLILFILSNSARKKIFDRMNRIDRMRKGAEVMSKVNRVSAEFRRELKCL